MNNNDWLELACTAEKNSEFWKRKYKEHQIPELLDYSSHSQKEAEWYLHMALLLEKGVALTVAEFYQRQSRRSKLKEAT